MPSIPKRTPPVIWSKKSTPITSSPSKTIRRPSRKTSKRSTWSISPPQHETIDKGHGRLEIRQIWRSTELNDYLDFPYVQQVFCVRREVTHLKSGKETEEIAYGTTSLSPQKANPNRLLQLNRGHWGIENRLHYVRDVTFDEDRSQIRTRNAPRVMASLRNFAISLLRCFQIKNIAKMLREMAARPYLSLKLIGL
ncbi:MAG: ISAs1 family transposase [candidate division Zixibacteria bacterium]|nr:ISAs1 family transposase [candidate division Zixibacteria bacterium]